MWQMLYGICFYGTWSSLCGIWYLVKGTWHMIHPPCPGFIEGYPELVWALFCVVRCIAGASIRLYGFLFLLEGHSHLEGCQTWGHAAGQKALKGFCSNTPRNIRRRPLLAVGSHLWQPRGAWQNKGFWPQQQEAHLGGLRVPGDSHVVPFWVCIGVCFYVTICSIGPKRNYSGGPRSELHWNAQV